MANRRAFTVTELLSVLGVLFLFIAVLMPAFGKAQRHARTVTCLYNLQNLHLAYTAYLNQNWQRAFPYDPSRQTFWMSALQPLLPDVQDICFCPDASVRSYGWGSAKSAWGPYNAARSGDSSLSFIGNKSSSYGFNAWLYSAAHEGDDGAYQSEHRRIDPDRVPVFADANWVEGWPLAGDSLPADTNTGAGPGEADLGRFFIARHGQSVNAGFLDGHAEQVPLGNLRSLSWASRQQLEPPVIRPK